MRHCHLCDIRIRAYGCWPTLFHILSSFSYLAVLFETKYLGLTVDHSSFCLHECLGFEGQGKMLFSFLFEWFTVVFPELYIVDLDENIQKVVLHME